MKLFSMFFIIIMSILSGCVKDHPVSQEEIPSCVQAKIEAIKKEAVRNPPAYVARYQYKGKSVYYVPSAAGDQMSELYGTDCQLICNPDGGISGRGDGKCPDFQSERKEEEIIWQDSRK